MTEVTGRSRYGLWAALRDTAQEAHRLALELRTAPDSELQELGYRPFEAAAEAAQAAGDWFAEAARRITFGELEAARRMAQRGYMHWSDLGRSDETIRDFAFGERPRR